MSIWMKSFQTSHVISWRVINQRFDLLRGDDSTHSVTPWQLDAAPVDAGRRKTLGGQ